MAVLSSDKYLVYDTKEKSVIKSFRSHKKDKKASKNPDSIIHQLPEYFTVSADDRVSIEVHKEAILMRNLVSNTIVAKFEGHSQAIKMVKFSYPSLDQMDS